MRAIGHAADLSARIMDGIFGLLVRDTAQESLVRLRARVPLHLADAEQFADDVTLLCGASAVSVSPDTVLVSAGRIHNRAELARALDCDPARVSDNTLFAHAHSRWGDRACHHIHGDWSYAFWSGANRTLTLARDRSGNTQLFYYANERVFAFATSINDLLALNLGPIAMDELYLAQTLISWTAYHGSRTIYSQIQRLPPAHILRTSPGRFDLDRYWRPDEIEPLRLRKRMDYVEGFREIFDRAVAERLSEGLQIAATLSGGLDSGSVAATAGRLLGVQGRRLSAYVATPTGDTAPYCGDLFGDEFPFALETSNACAAIDLHRVDAADVSPIAALREVLDITRHPEHAAGNVYWLLELYRTAARSGAKIILTGQMGNGGMSWTGSPGAWPLFHQLHREGWSSLARRRLREALPTALRTSYRRVRRPAKFTTSAIRQDFADRINLPWLWSSDPQTDPYQNSRDARLAILRPGASILGAGHAALGAAAGIEVTDPTADPRVIEFCLSVPDSVFVDAASGTDRWLIREAMRGRLPEKVRCNDRIGQQAGDLVPRLRAHAAEVFAALEEVAAGPGAEYVDTAKMAEVWRRVQTEDSPTAFRLSATLLTRGIMAGLFVNAAHNLSTFVPTIGKRG